MSSGDDNSSSDSESSDIGDLLAKQQRKAKSASKRSRFPDQSNNNNKNQNKYDFDDDDDDDIEYAPVGSSLGSHNYTLTRNRGRGRLRCDGSGPFLRGRRKNASVDDRLASLERNSNAIGSQKRADPYVTKLFHDDSDDDDDKDVQMISSSHGGGKENRNHNTMHAGMAGLTKPATTTPSSSLRAIRLADNNDYDYGLSSDEEDNKKPNMSSSATFNHFSMMKPFPPLVEGMDPDAYQQLQKAREAHLRLQRAQAYHGDYQEQHQYQEQDMAVLRQRANIAMNMVHLGYATDIPPDWRNIVFLSCTLVTEVEVIDGSEKSRRYRVQGLPMRGDETFQVLNERLIQNLNLSKGVLATFKSSEDGSSTTTQQSFHHQRTPEYYNITGPDVTWQAKIILSTTTAKNTQQQQKPKQNWGRPLELVLRVASSGQKHTVKHGEKQPFQYLVETAHKVLAVKQNKQKMKFVFDGEALQLTKTPQQYDMEDEDMIEVEGI